MTQSPYAIVETGGAFNCSFGVGVQKALLQHFQAPLPLIRIGSSGSAITTSFLTAEQENTGYHVLTECLSDPTLVKKGKFVDHVDVEKLVSYIEKSLNLDTLIHSPSQAFLALTEYKTGNSVYISNHDSTSKEKWFDYMKASMAMPFSFNKKVIIHGSRYSDGDIAGSLWSHIEKAFALGAQKVVAINNYSPGSFLNLNTLSILGYMAADSYHRKALYKRTKNDLRLKKKIQNWQEKIILITPPKPLPTSNFHNSKEALKATINIGYEYSVKNKSLKEFLSRI